MSTVVGLVRSRLQSKSRRGKSVDGVEIVLSEGGHLIRHRSLRQEALAEPTEDDLTVSPVRTNMAARTPNEFDPYTLADSLQNNNSRRADIPPVPSVPPIPHTAFPARQSSLQNSRAYKIKAHHRAASQNQWPEVGAEQPTRRRHYTISSPDERPRYNPQSGYFDQAPSRPAPTRTARLFGSIAENSARKSLESQNEDSRSDKPSHRRRSREMANSGRPMQDKSLPDRRELDSLDNLASLELSLPPIAPQPPLQLSKKETTTDPPEPARLPKDLKSQYSERTYVEEVWHPPVEQEVVEHRRTEVIHPEIARDIHVHHYYEYEQSVHVTEVLPPKHYRLDARTGEKIEIEPPPHWRMPRSISPSRVDVSGVKGTQRHYLVDEAHPDGVIEEWPQQEQVWI